MKAEYIKNWLDYLARPLDAYADEMTVVGPDDIEYVGALHAQGFWGRADIRRDGVTLYALCTNPQEAGAGIVCCMRREYKRLAKLEAKQQREELQRQWEARYLEGIKSC